MIIGNAHLDIIDFSQVKEVGAWPKWSNVKYYASAESYNKEALASRKDERSRHCHEL